MRYATADSDLQPTPDATGAGGGSSKRRSMLLAVAAITALAGYVAWNKDQFVAIELVAPEFLLLGVLGVVLTLAINGLVNIVMLRRLGVPAGTNECLSLATLTAAINLISPLRGGAAVRAVYLKRAYAFSYARFLSTMFGFYVLMIAVNGALAVAALTWLTAVGGRRGLSSLFVAAGLCVLFSVAAGLVPSLPARGRFLGKVNAVIEGWRVLRSSPRVVLLLGGLVAGHLFARLLTLWACYAALGVHLDAIALIVVTALGGISLLVSITPGSLGIYEAVVAVTAGLLSVPAAHSVMSALLSRGLRSGTLLLAGPAAAEHLARCAARRNSRMPIAEGTPLPTAHSSPENNQAA